MRTRDDLDRLADELGFELARDENAVRLTRRIAGGLEVEVLVPESITEPSRGPFRE
jgi:hypothetical protein